MIRFVTQKMYISVVKNTDKNTDKNMGRIEKIT